MQLRIDDDKLGPRSPQGELARQHFSDQQLVDLALAVVAISSWNRLAISFRTVSGTYQPAHQPQGRSDDMAETHR